jgi:hypothetical protein
MKEPIFFDTETCGLHGPIVLIQWALGDGPVQMHSVWKEPISDTLELLESLTTNPGGVIGFNLAFDWFHVCQLYTTLLRLPDHSRLPEDCIEEYALAEPGARDGDCLKPVCASDLMLVARRGPYQSMMARKPIRIRRVPTAIAYGLAAELENRVELSEIYFSRRKNKALPKWAVVDSKDRSTDKIDPNFKDVLLDFKASTALKVIANDLLGEDRYGRERSVYSDISMPAKFYPIELGYAPFALALSSPAHSWRVPRNFPIRKIKNVEIRGKKTWPALIEYHIRHWSYGTYARQYAEDDVKDTRGIWKAFDCPEPGDIDSELACMVGAVRWRGFTVDVEKIKDLRASALVRSKSAPRSPKEVKEFLFKVMSPMERLGTRSTKKVILEEMAGNKRQGKIPWQTDCPECEGEGTVPLPLEEVKIPRNIGTLTLSESMKVANPTTPCSNCKGSGTVDHPVAQRAQLVLDARKAKKDVEVYTKLIVAGRFHASFVVIGTLSSRMSGADNLNPQAIRSDSEFRSTFTLHHPGTVLCGGDYESFEVGLAEANYNDTKLREQLQSFTDCYKCGGTDPSCEDCGGSNRAKMKIHALFGTMCYPAMTYAEIVKNKIVYTRSKSGFFSQIYGGNFKTLMDRLGVDEQSARAAENRFGATYEGVARARQVIFDKFCSMRQPAGIGTHVEWHEPADYIENMLDPPFKRYFLLENQICKVIFNLANKPPAAWRELKDIKIQRDTQNRDRFQTLGGAAQSALYGAAFQIQAANMRAAANHVIQSTGAEITKATQLAIWELQPSGINRWLVQPMNVHDEIECNVADDPALIERVKQTVLAKVETYRELVPLIGMEWKVGMQSWGEK